MKYLIIISLALVTVGASRSAEDFMKIFHECMSENGVTQEELIETCMKKEISDKLVAVTNCMLRSLEILDSNGNLHPEVIDSLIEEATKLCQSGTSDACHAVGELHKTKKCASVYKPDNDSPHPVAKGLLKCMFQE